METEFKKWVDIENSYNQKFIDFFSDIYPEIATAKYVISEKNDGANFSIIFYPCSSFNLLLEEEQKKCFHYTNLQPLWAEENRRKSNTL